MIQFITALSMRVFSDISNDALPKRSMWINIKSLIFVKEISISFVNCAQEGASLITKQGAVKKNWFLFQDHGHSNKMDLGYIENYIWIYPCANDLH